MRIARVAIIVATMLLAASRADATPPVLVNDTSHPSVVTVTDAFFTHSTEYSVPIDVVCVGFVQNGQKTAKQVGLSLAYVDAQGTVIGVEVNYSYGKFGSGLPAGTSTPRYPVDHPFNNNNCHKTIHDGRDVTSSFMYRPRGAPQAVAVAGIVASAREVVYEDGTAFRTDDVPKTGDKLPFAIPSPAAAVPSGGPLYSASTSVTEPFKVLDVVPYGNRGEICYTLQNGAKNATLARTALVKVGRNGNVLEVEESQTTGRYAAGAPMGSEICTRVKGRDVGVELFVDTDGDARPSLASSPSRCTKSSRTGPSGTTRTRRTREIRPNRSCSATDPQSRRAMVMISGLVAVTGDRSQSPNCSSMQRPASTRKGASEAASKNLNVLVLTCG